MYLLYIDPLVVAERRYDHTEKQGEHRWEN
jgi:hypothetical protein